MALANIRRTSSATRIPVSVDRLKSKNFSNSRNANAKELSTTRINAWKSNGDISCQRTHSVPLSPALAAMALEEPSLEHQMDSSMETVFRRWDTETTSVAIAERAADSSSVGANTIGSPLNQAKQNLGASQCEYNEARTASGKTCNLGGRSVGGPVSNRSLERVNQTVGNSTNRLSSAIDSRSDANTELLSETPFPCSTDYLSSSKQPRRLQNESGRREVFHVEFDAPGYNPDDITVHVTGTRLTVHGVRRDSDNSEGVSVSTAGVDGIGSGLRRTTTEFCRRLRLPDDVDRTGLTCVMVDGLVIIEAPRSVCNLQNSDNLLEPGKLDDIKMSRELSACSNKQTSSLPLNTPIIRTSAGGTVREMSLSVDVGRIFRPTDVTVKVKNSSLSLTVVAERVECSPAAARRRAKPVFTGTTTVSGISDVAVGETWRKLNAHLTLEYDLPGPVDMNTLKAGITVEGLLRITAVLTELHEKEPVR